MSPQAWELAEQRTSRPADTTSEHVTQFQHPVRGLARQLVCYVQFPLYCSGFEGQLGLQENASRTLADGVQS